MKTKLIILAALLMGLEVKAQFVAPLSATNLQVAMIPTAGVAPFYGCNAYYFITAPKTNTFQIKSTCGYLVSTGKYTYFRTSTNQAYLTFTDSVVGAGNTQTIFFRNNLCGTYAITNSVNHAWQRGKFMFMNR